MIRRPVVVLCLIAALAARVAGDEPKPADTPPAAEGEKAPAAEPPKPEPTAAPPAPAYAGEEMCVACHEAQASSYATTPHARPLADPSRPEPLRSCEACHGPGQAHVDEGGGKGVGNLETFAADRPAGPRSAACLKCHAGAAEMHDFKRGDHARAGLSCTDCHRLHGGDAPLLARPTPQLCYGCHLEIRAKFSLTEHHKVNEGVMSCMDCHNPHGRSSPSPMRGSDNLSCFRCHGDYEGPYVFEHVGLVTEGCVRCHEPHGSINRHLLVRQQVAQLCYECHTVTPATHVQPSFRDCTSCHVAVHGSNIDPRLLER